MFSAESHAPRYFCFFFFFNDTATTEIYTLSLHDALPISALLLTGTAAGHAKFVKGSAGLGDPYFPKAGNGGYDELDRKSTRLNSSHLVISYAVFCLKKKRQTTF